MSSRLPSMLAAVVLVAVLAFYMCFFEVRTTEVAIVKTFGEVRSDAIAEPGLKWKWPWPVQEVVKYDTRIRILEDTVEETPTVDSRNVTITTFTGWVVSDPYKFHTAYPDPKEGEQALRTKIRTHKKAVIGRHRFSEFVSTQEQERKLDEIENEMMQLVADEARQGFGVDIKVFGIKKLGLPSEVTSQIFEKMKAEQKTKAINFEAEGKAKAQDILAEARSKKEDVLAEAQRKVDEIESDGRRRVGEIYKSFEAHPELRIFLDKLRALEEIFQNRTQMFFDTSQVPIDLFDEDKRLQPRELRLDLEAAAEPVPLGSAGQSGPEAESGATPERMP